MKLSVLDQSPIRAGSPPAASIAETLALAQACEGFGYERFWVSEHHNSASVAGTAPEILIAAIATRTERIRIGSAGVMLPHYASLKVAETFRVLEALAPGRIDLGLGRAPGSDMATALALNPDAGQAANRFGTQVQEVIALLDGLTLPVSLPAAYGGPRAMAGIAAQPIGSGSPEVWILGSSNWGAQAAAALGLPYCFAYFFSDGQGADEALDLYQSRFRPSERLARPRAGIAVFAFAAETEERAWYEHRAREAWMLARDMGRYEPIRDPAGIEFPEALQGRLARIRERAVVGTADRVVRQLGTIASSVGAEEVAVVTAGFDPAARRRSYELIADAAGIARLDGSGVRASAA